MLIHILFITVQFQLVKKKNFFLIGDYNLDGYPDILVVTSNGKESHVTLLQSILCTTRNCHASAVASQRRTFVKVSDGAQPLNNINNAKNAAFLDLDEDVKRKNFFLFEIYLFSIR